MPIFSFDPAGAERVALHLAKAWREAGETVTVVLGRPEGDTRTAAPELDYVWLPSRILAARFRSLWMIWSTWRYLRRHPADVLFCPGNAYAVVGAAMRLLSPFRAPPMVIKISNDLVRRDRSAAFRWAYGKWLRIQGRLFDRFVGLAPPMQAEIAARTGAGADRTVIAGNASLTDGQYDSLVALPPAPPAGPSRFLAIGRLVPQKNFALLIRAFAKGAGPEDTLTILGEGPERGMLERLVAELGLAERVALPGHEADTTMRFREASALLLSSDFEGLPAVVVEALAAGRPIVATDCCVSMAALLGHGGFGMLVPTADEDGFAHAIAAIPRMPFDAAAARAAARAFTLGRTAPRYLAVFKELTGEMARRRAADYNKRVTVLSR